ncbi:MAG: histidine phosphatase family protein [Epsilonproteobacteria bacterium]|nr:histidine phosphatase family protein [Campylobacterota bacterium]
MKIYFVRHSEVIEPYQGKYNGHIDIELSIKGKKDAFELEKKLLHVKFQKVFCSDLLRAKQTLQMMQIDAPVVYTKALREKSWGRHEGKSFEQITQEGIVYKNFLQWIEALDGEDMHTYMQRVQDYFHQEILTCKAENVLVVTHAGVIKTLISIEEQIPLEKAFGISLGYSEYLVYDTNKGFLLPTI